MEKVPLIRDARNRDAAPNPLLEAALEYAGIGWPVFPLHTPTADGCSCGKSDCGKKAGKHPRTTHGLKDASTDPTIIRAWWTEWPHANIGVVTGPVSGIVVVDIDGELGRSSVDAWREAGIVLPETRVHQTSRGQHMFFRYPTGAKICNSESRIARGIDIRGDGGYAVMPPSLHRSGPRYTCANESAPVADCPQRLLEMLQQPARHLPATTSKPPSSIGIGQRRPLLFKLAGKLRSEGVPRAGIIGAMTGLNATFTPPHDDAKIQELAKAIERYPAGQTPRTLVPIIVCLADIRALPVPWLWKGYLAFGMLAMLSGDPDAGKTFIALAIAASLSKGLVPISGAPCAPITTLYLSHENAPEHVIRPRFDALAGDASRFHLLRGSTFDDDDGKTKFGVTLKEIDVLEAALQQTGATLIVIDPIQSYLGAEVDAHRSNETRPVMDGLIGLAERYNACVLLVRHLSKSSGGRAIHRGLGSIDLTGAVRMEMLAGNAAGDASSRALVPIKNNVGPRADSVGYQIVGEEMDARLEWRGKSELTADDLLAPDTDSEERTDIADASAFIRDQLASGPKRQTDLETESGFSQRTLQRAGKKVGIQRSRDGERGPWLWSLRIGA